MPNPQSGGQGSRSYAPCGEDDDDDLGTREKVFTRTFETANNFSLVFHRFFFFIFCFLNFIAFTLKS